MAPTRPMDSVIARGRNKAPGACPPRNLYAMKICTGTKDVPQMRQRCMLPKRQSSNIMQDSDGEDLNICPECRLPVGDFGYANSAKTAFLHGECKAQLILREAKEDEEARLRSDTAVKNKERCKYNIGWKKELIPRNRLQGRQISTGMCCLKYDSSSNMIRVVPTVDPAASVNLEYLSLAFIVRVQEGREPLFSLDMKGTPTSNSNEPEDLWQVKRFEPSWLAGTSAGEVMFQADYHLKELSMGEEAQPVIGMLSAFDLAKEEWHEKDWRAREWFVVNQAEIRVSEENVLIPYVKMGVEARELTNGPNGLEDSLITRSEHPMVKYAKACTHYFDLIAERKGAIFHLRELAKASVLAKHILDAQIEIEESFFDLAPEVKRMYRLEVPQLWNQRSFSQVNLKDGKIMDAEKGMDMGTRGVYGGIAFGLDKAELGATTMQPGAGEAPYSLLFSAADRGAVMARGVVTPPSLMEPRGVDLNLNKFDLSETVNATQAGKATVGEAFWATIACNEGSVFLDDDKALLKDVFNPHLSDRREEGDLFVPPDARVAHLDNLRALIKEEAQARSQRKQHFGSKDFVVGAAGPLFPPSWTNNFDIAQVKYRTEGLTIAKHDQQMTNSTLKSAPIFNNVTEDGTRFRIYRKTDVEVRTTQEHDGEETVIAVFSTVTRDLMVSQMEVTAGDKITKGVEYVEQSEDDRQFYVVLETETGSFVIAEKLKDGSVAWIENPKHLELRNASAKVTRSVDECCTGITTGEMKAAVVDDGTFASSSKRKAFAHGVLHRLLTNQA